MLYFVICCFFLSFFVCLSVCLSICYFSLGRVCVWFSNNALNRLECKTWCICLTWHAGSRNMSILWMIIGTLAAEICCCCCYLVDGLFCSQLSSSSPQCGQVMTHGQGMHSELEMYASRLAEAEQRQRAMSTPDLSVWLLLACHQLIILLLLCFHVNIFLLQIYFSLLH